MRGKNRKVLCTIIALGLAATLAVSGCVPKQSTTGGEDGVPQKGGIMSYGIAEPVCLDPYSVQESEGIQVVQALFDSLTWFDPFDPTKLLPSAADSWSSNEDATVWTFKLNPGGKFSDGAPVKAQDFVYAWNRVVSPKTVNTLSGDVDPSPVGYHLNFVKGYDEVADDKASELSGLRAIDDLTLEVTLTQPFADFEYIVAHPALSPVPKALVEGGVEYDGKKVPYGDMPVGNGSFKMAEPWKHNQYINIVRNDGYVGDTPYLDGVSFRIFENPETAYSEFEAGSLDFTQIGEGKIADAKAKYGVASDGYTANPGQQVLLGAQAATYYLILNIQDDSLKNTDLRRAISLAINRQAICDTVFEGTRESADNIIPPGIAGYQKGGWPDSRYDVEAAKKALAEAGYPEGNGLAPLRLAFNSDGGHEKIMELIQADLKAIGITAEFQASDWGAYLDQIDGNKHQIARMAWQSDYPIAHGFLYPLFDSKSDDNRSNYENLSVDRGIAEAVAITDDAARVKKLVEVNVAVAAETPVVPVLFYCHNNVASDRVHDFVLSPLALGYFEKAWISTTE
ncbi:MAG: peptide ABC transporter substrate-binding protein [Coriobacteriia bacterium]|nr:peptide ABC transporter substrate-binding protein [Coriobacteriia bacterium]